MLNRTLIQKEYYDLDDIIYLDTSKVSLPPLRVREGWKAYVEGYAGVYCLNYETYFPEKLEKARDELAKLLHTDRDEIAFTHSASDSITMLANSFPFQAGDNVILTAEEHPSNVIPWLSLKRFGVEIKFIPSKDGFVDAADVIAAIDENTRIVSTSSAFFCSGYAIDMGKIAAACKQRDVFYAVDATQTVGLMDISPRELGIDYMVGGGHKALLGTKSVGFAFCSRALLKKLRPFTGSLQSAKDVGRPCHLRDYDEIEWFQSAACLESGNYPYGVIEALGNGVSLINELGVENIEVEVRNLENQLRERIKDLPLKVIDPPVENRSGMLFVYYPEHANPKLVADVLWKNRVRASVRYDYIRMTLDFYNTEDQLDRVASTLFEISAL